MGFRESAERQVVNIGLTWDLREHIAKTARQQPTPECRSHPGDLQTPVTALEPVRRQRQQLESPFIKHRNSTEIDNGGGTRSGRHQTIQGPVNRPNPCALILATTPAQHDAIVYPSTCVSELMAFHF